MAISATICWTSWNPAIGLPNCSRFRQKSIDASRHAWDRPTAPIDMLNRPMFTAPIASLNPPPTSPSTLAAGTKMSSKVSSQLVVERTGMCGMS